MFVVLRTTKWNNYDGNKSFGHGMCKVQGS